ncbi:MAG: putative dienelactone hydrolase [Paraglaciecola sp.]|jgi:predicted dienelactone hydrolase
MKMIILISAVIVITCSTLQSNAAEQLYTQQPSMTPELAKTGPWNIGVTTLQITNPQQLDSKDFQSSTDRNLTLEVWYPAQVAKKQALASYENVTRLHQPFSLQGSAYRDAPVVKNDNFPLVVLSHGYTGYRTIMFYLGEHLASHGYVVVGIDHSDSTTGEIDFKNAPFAGFPSTLINRARDQQFVLQHFSTLKSNLAASVDTENSAIIGYSMGGYGAINTIGGCYNFNSTGLQGLGFPEQAANALLPVFNSCNAGLAEVDKRWKAMVALAPWGQELNVHSGSALAKISVPSLYVVGDQDDISGYENGVKKLFQQTGAEHKYMLVYENARHNIAPHPAPRVAHASDEDLGHYAEPSWSSEALNRINKHMTLAFLNCHVKKQKTGCDYLPLREDITQIKDSDGKMNAPWPGFADRWGTGVKFYRGK